MARFEIKNGFTLRASGKLMFPKSLYSTENEAELQELREVFCKTGSAVEIVPKAPETPFAPTEKTVDPNDDITLAKGVGKALSAKLAEKGITTFSGLKSAMLDAARVEEMKELMGIAYEKVMKNFEAPVPPTE